MIPWHTAGTLAYSYTGTVFAYDKQYYSVDGHWVSKELYLDYLTSTKFQRDITYNYNEFYINHEKTTKENYIELVNKIIHEHKFNNKLQKELI